MGFPEQLVPSEIKNQRLQPFLPPERSQSRPTQRGQKTSFQATRKRPNQGPMGPSFKRVNPNAQNIKKIFELLYLLEFYNKLCDIENNLLIVFNKLNNSEYTNGIVNLSSYSLTNTEITVLSKGLGFCPTPWTPDIGNIVQDLDAF